MQVLRRKAQLFGIPLMTRDTVHLTAKNMKPIRFFLGYQLTSKQDIWQCPCGLLHDTAPAAVAIQHAGGWPC